MIHFSDCKMCGYVYLTFTSLYPYSIYLSTVKICEMRAIIFEEMLRKQKRIGEDKQAQNFERHCKEITHGTKLKPGESHSASLATPEDKSRLSRKTVPESVENTGKFYMSVHLY